jgi:hypothetical protein
MTNFTTIAIRPNLNLNDSDGSIHLENPFERDKSRQDSHLGYIIEKMRKNSSHATIFIEYSDLVGSDNVRFLFSSFSCT